MNDTLLSLRGIRELSFLKAFPHAELVIITRRKLLAPLATTDQMTKQAGDIGYSEHDVS